MGLPKEAKCTLVLNSDEIRFGGTGAKVSKTVKAEKIEWDNQPYSIGFTLPPFGAVVYKFD